MSERSGKLILPVLVVLHMVIALPLAYLLNTWADEASTLYTTQHGIVATFNSLFTNEKQAPLYFLTLSAWRLIDDSIFFSRLFSVIFSVLSIIAFSRFAARIWDEKNALTATALFAFHPYLFWASLEIRLYSLVILLSCLLLIFFVDSFLSDENTGRSRRSSQILFTITAIASLYTNYYLGFPLVGCFVALLVLRRRRDARNYFYLMLAVAVAILPLMYIVSLQFSDRASTFQEEKSVFVAARMIWNHFLTFTLPTEIFTPEKQTAASFARLWILRLSILAAFFASIKYKFKGFDRTFVALVSIFAISALFMIAVYFQLGSTHIEIRHASIYFVPIFAIVVSVAIAVLSPYLRIATILVVLFFYGYSLLTLYPTSVKQGDWANVSAFISATETSDQPIVVFPVYESVGLLPYYKGVNRVLPDEQRFSFVTDHTKSISTSYSREIEFVISAIPSDATQIWLLTSDACDLRDSCISLENFVNANYTVEQDQRFYRERVRLLRRKE